MPGQKRRLSHDSPRQSTKRLATDSAVMSAFNDDDEDSLESILAQIKAHEESEALARKLQEEWDETSDTGNPGLSSSRPRSRRGPSSSTERSFSTNDHPDVIELSDGDSIHDEQTQVPEDDEAMARRLAKEWEIEDSARLNDNHQPPASTSMLSPRRTKRRAKRLVVQSRSGSASDPIAIDDKDDITVPNEKLPPVAQLEECRALFTGDKTCSSCSAKLPSPRGHVNKLIS